jgi:hypothetical protein
MSGRERDPEHPYGHGRAENVGALGEAGFLLAHPLVVAFRSVTVGQLAVATPEGGKLEVVLVGPGDGRVLIHQTRTAGWLFADHVEAGVERGLRHVTYSRPGYARSERHAGRTIADCKRDRVAFEFTGTIENVNVRYTS